MRIKVLLPGMAGFIIALTGPSFAEDKAATQGVRWIASYTGEAAANPVGGLRKSQAFAGQALIGAEFDMSRLAGVKGGRVKLYITNRHGENLQEKAIGNNTSVQEIYGTQNTHLAVLSWEQQLLDERLTIEAGRLPANISFLSSPLYCHFQGNSVCGNPTFVFKTSNFTYWPASSWGAHAKGWLTDKTYLHVGAYEVNPERKTERDHGIDFGTAQMTGVIYPWEFGYSTTFDNDSHPRNYRVGGWVDTGDYEDPLYDDQGGIRVLTRRPALMRSGRTGVFTRFDQVIWRRDDISKHNLSVFGVAMAGTSGHLAERSFFDLGIVRTGTFRGRDQDTIGFVISHQVFTGEALQAIRAARLHAGGDGDIPRSQTMMELAYGAQITPQLRVSPNLQYIHNPDQTSVPFRTQDIKDAFVVGFKFTFDPMTRN